MCLKLLIFVRQDVVVCLSSQLHITYSALSKYQTPSCEKNIESSTAPNQIFTYKVTSLLVYNTSVGAPFGEPPKGSKLTANILILSTTKC